MSRSQALRQPAFEVVEDEPDFDVVADVAEVADFEVVEEEPKPTKKPVPVAKKAARAESNDEKDEPAKPKKRKRIRKVDDLSRQLLAKEDADEERWRRFAPQLRVDHSVDPARDRSHAVDHRCLRRLQRRERHLHCRRALRVRVHLRSARHRGAHGDRRAAGDQLRPSRACGSQDGRARRSS